MPYKKLLTVVTMMLMIGSKAGAQQSFNISDLRKIESLIGQKDCGALYEFLTTKPGLVSGTDPLARELQGFVRNVESGNLDCFAAPVVERKPVTNTALTSASVNDNNIY